MMMVCTKNKSKKEYLMKEDSVQNPIISRFFKMYCFIFFFIVSLRCMFKIILNQAEETNLKERQLDDVPLMISGTFEAVFQVSQLAK